MRAVKIYIPAIFFIMLAFHSCNFGDSTENLGGGYFYRNEGEAIKDILCKKTNGGEVPATVTDFDFNTEFIVAKQKPKLPQDPLYDNNYTYDRGDKVYYYWIIIKSDNRVLGPLSLEEFDNLKIKHKIPNSLVLK